MSRSIFALLVMTLMVSLSSAVLAQQPEARQQTVVIETINYVCPMHPDVQSKVPGKCSKCNMTLVAVADTQKLEEFYVCPMHPNVISVQAGKCPVCQMSLVKMDKPEMGEFNVKFETTPRLIKPGEKVRFRFTVFHPTTGEQVKEFNIMHDMPFHLFLVSQDFEDFQHIHPDQQSDGSFVIETVLARAGYYKVFCDIFPKGGMPQVLHHSLITDGYEGDLVSAQAKLVPDQSLTKTLEGTRFELTIEPEEPIPGRPVQPYAGKYALLKYHLVDEKSGKPVTDLRPYLGAWGHTLILSEDGTDYLHSHPTEMIPDEVDRSKLSGISDVTFDTLFPRPGNYRIWSQFQRGEKLITVSFTIYVPRLT